MNFLQKFIGSSTTDEIALLPSGRLFLVRSPESPKGALECLYNDAFGSIRLTTTPYYHKLSIIRVLQESELGHHELDESDDDELDERERASNDTNKDEWTFPITEDLGFYTYTKPNGLRSIGWVDINGDIDDRFEFVVDADVKLLEVDNFVLTLFKCLYENKYQQLAANITSLDQLQYLQMDTYGDAFDSRHLRKDCESGLSDLSELSLDVFHDAVPVIERVNSIEV